jgi:cell division protein FtsZ
LVNITSAEGEHEITMDEEDTIMSYLRQEAGEDTDVIKGIGFDESLGNKIGVTIIATGFEHKDPFKAAPKKEDHKPVEKILLKLNEGEERKSYSQPSLPLEDKDPFAPSLVEMPNTAPSVIHPSQQFYQHNADVRQEQLSSQPREEQPIRVELKSEVPPVSSISARSEGNNNNPGQPVTNNNTFVQQGNTFLAKPSNIYAEPKSTESQSLNPIEAQPSQPIITNEHPELEMKLVMKDELPETADEPKLIKPVASIPPVEDLAMQDDAEEQKRRAQERIQKLRNLSFNMNTADASNEFDSVPAYIRRNMELFGNTLTSVESFYSKYSVKPDENDKGQISSINTFLDGKKPD